nr:tRNA-dihydrouridine(16/17) synthase [NAD(P)(+)]-like [Tanacetum cinerariifolium]
MDQMASACGDANKLLVMDCQDLNAKLVDFGMARYVLERWENHVSASIMVFLQRFILDACRDTTLIILMVAAAASLVLGIKTEEMFVVFKNSMMTDSDMTDLGTMRYFLVHNPALPGLKLTKDEKGTKLMAPSTGNDEKDWKKIRANWDAIRAVKSSLKILVLANGNIRHMDGVQYCLEQTGVDGDLRPADLLLFNWLQGKDACLDVTCISPFAGIGATSWAHEVALNNVVEKKKRKYVSICEENGYKFIPFAFSTFREFDTEALDRLSRDVMNYAFLASRLQSAVLQTKLLRHSDIVTSGPAFDNVLSDFNVKIEIDFLSNP